MSLNNSLCANALSLRKRSHHSYLISCHLTSFHLKWTELDTVRGPVQSVQLRWDEICGVKQESGRLRCRFSYLSLAIFSESSPPRLKSATHSICVKLLHKHDKLTQCCRAFTLALARLSCNDTCAECRQLVEHVWCFKCINHHYHSDAIIADFFQPT